MNGEPDSTADGDLTLVRAALHAGAPADPGLPVERLVAALTALRPEVLERFAGLGFDAAVAEETLADVPRKVSRYGTPATSGPDVGIDAGWLLGLARADVVSLGRLQFERLAGADGRGVHVPEAGPLDPAAVDASLARAREVLGEEPLTCTSWFLDPVLPPALGPGSRLVAFAGRFATGPVHREPHADRVVAKFVFRRPVRDVLDEGRVHPGTSLERCVAQHLRAGRHWSEPSGVLRG